MKYRTVLLGTTALVLSATSSAWAKYNNEIIQLCHEQLNAPTAIAAVSGRAQRP